MKTLIVSINSKYIHSSLAPWYLLSGVYSYAKEARTAAVREFTINQPVRKIVEDLVEEQADAYAFCTYIWNIKTIKQVLPLLKTALPLCRIILGGPEVSFCPEQILSELPVDYVCCGEGEESLPLLLDAIASGRSPDDIPGICFEKAGICAVNAPQPLSSYPPDPYLPEYFETLNGRIVYIEGSRGCPFSCAFCLSGREDRLRLFPIERVKSDILRLSVSGAKTIKFVDRTFNCRKDRCNEIIAFILTEYGKGIPRDICFHFEVAADLFDDETLQLLSSAPKGLFQLEAGLQSFHSETLAAVTRKTDLKRLCDSVKRILAAGNIHLHIDLIAGLPKEDMNIFKQSFNRAYALQPHMLQLGFLKLLYGSALRGTVDENGYLFSEQAPYEVYTSHWMTADNFAQLHQVEDVVERLYNSGRFSFTLQYVLKTTAKKPFDLFSGMAEFLYENGVDTAGITLDAYTEYALRYFSSLKDVNTDVLRDWLVCDSLCSKQLNRLPLCLTQTDKRIAKIKRQLAQKSPTAAIKRGVALLRAQKDKVAVVEYTDRDPITNRYALQILTLDQFEL